MKKGFTLIELLAVLALLGVIILVSVPSIISTNKKSQENDYNQYIANIQGAAEVYIETHEEKYEHLKTTYGATASVSIDNLINGGYIKGSIKNPKTNKALSEEAGSVTVTNQNGTLKYNYAP